jgi:hypothetical protein
MNQRSGSSAIARGRRGGRGGHGDVEANPTVLREGGEEAVRQL